MNRHSYSIFSDDVRHEIGNKRSIIGIYTGKMFVPSFPVLLPKLCISVSIVTPIGNPFKSAIIRILADDIVFAEHRLDEAQLIASQPESVEPENPDKPLVIQAHAEMQISPFPVEKAVTLRIRVATESEELKAGALTIELMKAP